MKVSAKTEYACIALLELAARHGSGEPVRIRDIADRHGIPSRFLVQILLQLKGAGLVASTRGASGGYQMLKAPEEISLGEVMAVIDGPADNGASSAAPDSAAGRILADAWREINDLERQMLGSLTFADLIERAKAQNEPMYHI